MDRVRLYAQRRCTLEVYICMYQAQSRGPLDFDARYKSMLGIPPSARRERVLTHCSVQYMYSYFIALRMQDPEEQAESCAASSFLGVDIFPWYSYCKQRLPHSSII